MKKENFQNFLKKSNNRMELLYRTTEAEAVAYSILERLGIRAVKQQPFNTGARIYYADLYVPSLRLVIEIDGGYHTTEEQQRKDRNRSAGLRRLGVHVCRLSNRDARSIDKIRAIIRRYLRG